MFYEELGSTRWNLQGVKDDAVEEGDDDYISLYVCTLRRSSRVSFMLRTYEGHLSRSPSPRFVSFGRGSSGDISGTQEEVHYACHHGQSQ